MYFLQERLTSSPRDIYGAHYDEGRIYRQSTSDPVWAKLAQKAIPRYSEIERESGKVAPSLLFFYVCTYLYKVPYERILSSNTCICLEKLSGISVFLNMFDTCISVYNRSGLRY